MNERGVWRTLERDQWLMAGLVGLQRQISAMSNSQRDKQGAGGRDGYAYHILGALGEYVASLVLDIRWNISTDRPDHGGDLGGQVEVRTRTSHAYELNIRPDDSEERPYVLVTGAGPQFCVRGWMFGGEAKQARWWKQVSARPAEYFVPQAQLRPIWTLCAYLRDPDRREEYA